jgi:hypothetical protein
MVITDKYMNLITTKKVIPKHYNRNFSIRNFYSAHDLFALAEKITKKSGKFAYMMARLFFLSDVRPYFFLSYAYFRWYGYLSYLCYPVSIMMLEGLENHRHKKCWITTLTLKLKVV